MSTSSCCSTEAEPLRDVNALLNWTETDLALEIKSCLSKIPQITVTPKEEGSSFGRPQTLVCHDMKGGYTEDRFLQGCPAWDAYRLLHWAVLDWFVYFSHHLVTVPPPGWVAAAHANGVPVLGTVITEFDGGERVCRELFSCEETVCAAVERLLAIAVSYKLHGWLINIENEMEASELGFLKLFCRKLTEGMKRTTPGSMVIWYDSVTLSGKLKWQDQVNENNYEWFSLCDAIFLNYSWTEKKLQNSVEFSKRMSKVKNYHRNIFVGVDVFGRNFYEGGGFNTHKAMQVIRKHDLSAAIFAPGWSHETRPDSESFPERDHALWGPLRPHVTPHGPTAWPLDTTFSHGSGEALYRGGEVVAGPWFELSQTSLLPLLDGSAAQLSTASALEGGSCLRLAPGPQGVVLWEQCRLRPVEGRLCVSCWCDVDAPLAASCDQGVLTLRFNVPEEKDKKLQKTWFERHASLPSPPTPITTIVVSSALPSLALGRLRIAPQSAL